MEFVSAGDVGVAGGNRGTGNHHLGMVDILGAMAFEDSGAEFGKALRDRGTLQVRSRHFIAEIQQDLGDTAHADPADAYEMNALDFCEHKSTSRSPISRMVEKVRNLVIRQVCNLKP